MIWQYSASAMVILYGLFRLLEVYRNGREYGVLFVAAGLTAFSFIISIGVTVIALIWRV